MSGIKRFVFLLYVFLFFIFSSFCLAQEIKSCPFSFKRASSNPAIYIASTSKGMIVGVAPKKGNILYITTYKYYMGNEYIYVYLEKGSEFYVFYLDDVVVCQTP